VSGVSFAASPGDEPELDAISTAIEADGSAEPSVLSEGGKTNLWAMGESTTRSRVPGIDRMWGVVDDDRADGTCFSPFGQLVWSRKDPGMYARVPHRHGVPWTVSNHSLCSLAHAKWIFQ
jgi:hypothetical protein